jgi:hypothetical protein
VALILFDKAGRFIEIVHAGVFVLFDKADFVLTRHTSRGFPQGMAVLYMLETMLGTH